MSFFVKIQLVTNELNDGAAMTNCTSNPIKFQVVKRRQVVAVRNKQALALFRIVSPKNQDFTQNTLYRSAQRNQNTKVFTETTFFMQKNLDKPKITASDWTHAICGLRRLDVLIAYGGL